VDPEQLQILSALIQAMPGETAQNRLNYFQDLMGQLNVDPFGTQQPVIQEWQAPASQVRAMYGQNPGLQAVFQAIDEGVDPLTAMRGAIADDRFPELSGMDITEKQNYTSSLNKVAEDYSSERAETAKNKANFERQQAQKAAESPTPLQQLLPGSVSAYEQTAERLGFEPTAENLLKEYSQFLYEKGLEKTKDSRAAASKKVPPPTMVTRPVTTLTPGGTNSVINLPSLGAGQTYAPGSRLGPPIEAAPPSAPPSAPPVSGGKSVPSSFSQGQISSLDYGFTGPYGENYRRRLTSAAERAANRARQRRVDVTSPESEQFIQNLAYALLLQGD
jgi:hypothetical protein